MQTLAAFSCKYRKEMSTYGQVPDRSPFPFPCGAAKIKVSACAWLLCSSSLLVVARSSCSSLAAASSYTVKMSSPAWCPVFMLPLCGHMSRGPAPPTAAIPPSLRAGPLVIVSGAIFHQQRHKAEMYFSPRPAPPRPGQCCCHDGGNIPPWRWRAGLVPAVACHAPLSRYQGNPSRLLHCHRSLATRPRNEPPRSVKLYNHREWPYSWLKVTTGVVTFKTLLRHYGKWALTHGK